jgi:hypothetical protein
VLNPTDTPCTAELRLGFPVHGASAVRLDEEPCSRDVEIRDGQVRFDVPARALRSVLLV